MKSYKIAKLNDELMSEVSGGVDPITVIKGVEYGSGATAGACALSGIACRVASLVYLGKARKARLNGEDSEADKFAGIAKRTSVAATSLGYGLGAAAVVGISASVLTGDFGKASNFVDGKANTIKSKADQFFSHIGTSQSGY